MQKNLSFFMKAINVIETLLATRCKYFIRKVKTDLNKTVSKLGGDLQNHKNSVCKTALLF